MQVLKETRNNFRPRRAFGLKQFVIVTHARRARGAVAPMIGAVALQVKLVACIFEI